MAYSPVTGLVYIPAREASWAFHPTKETWFKLGIDDIAALEKDQPNPEFAGQLLAWDPVAQKPAWRVMQPGIYNGGALATAGNLVLHGDGDGYFYAHAADTGEELLKIELGTGVLAPPITYALDGVQYVALVAGFGGPVFNTLDDTMAVTRYENDGRLLVFKLDGGPVPLPEAREPLGPFPAPPVIEASAEQIAHGEELYSLFCGGCHGMYGSIPMLPDLRRMTPETHDVFDEIVLNGLYEVNGMGRFDDLLSQADVDAIYAYVVDLNRKAYDDEAVAKKSQP